MLFAVSAVSVRTALSTVISPVPPFDSIPPEAFISFNVIFVELTLSVSFTLNVNVATVSGFVTFVFL